MLYSLDYVDRVETMLYSMNRDAEIESGQGGLCSPYRGVMEQLVVSVLTINELGVSSCANATYDAMRNAQSRRDLRRDRYAATSYECLTLRALYRIALSTLSRFLLR